jgi:transketolase
MTASTALSTPIAPPVLDERCIDTLRPQITVRAVDTSGASVPGPVVTEHYGFSVDNIYSRRVSKVQALEQQQ